MKFNVASFSNESFKWLVGGLILATLIIADTGIKGCQQTQLEVEREKTVQAVFISSSTTALKAEKDSITARFIRGDR